MNLGRAWESAFLSSSQGMPMLVVYGPHLELQGLCLLCRTAGTASLLSAFLLALGEQHPGFRWPKKEEFKNVSMKGNLPPRFVDSATSVGTSSVKISKYFSDKFGTQASCKGKTKTRKDTHWGVFCAFSGWINVTLTLLSVVVVFFFTMKVYQFCNKNVILMKTFSQSS